MRTTTHPILRIADLSHKYNDHYAIKDINLEIDKTGIMGLLGANGAGKSTTMNILCGVLKPTAGRVWIEGTDMQQEPELCKTKLGFLPQHPPLYLDFSVDEYLVYCAQLRRMDKQHMRRALDTVKERCGIAHFSNRLIRNLSGGYRQRVGIAQAIIHAPKLVVLDEPTNGLDPNQILEVRHLIREIAQERAVIFSSHILSEVQVLCDDITMIDNGRIVFADTMQAFDNYIKPHSLLVRLGVQVSADMLLQVPGVTGVTALARHFRVHFSDERSIAAHIIQASTTHGWDLQEISFDKSSIEEVFAQLSNKPGSK